MPVLLFLFLPPPKPPAHTQSVKTGIQHLAKLMLNAEKAGQLPPVLPGSNTNETFNDGDVDRSNPNPTLTLP